MKIRLRRCTALMLAAAILLTFGFGAFAADDSSDTVPGWMTDGSDAKEATDAEYETIAENTHFSLAVNAENGRFTLTDKKSGKEWGSNPPDAEEDDFAKGINRTNLYSQLWVQYIDKAGSENATNSHAGSYRKDGLQVKIQDSGFVAVYDFPELGITIPIKVELTDTGIKASIAFSEIKETADNLIYNITLYPYLCAASMQDTGWLLVPDGSGALIYLNNQKNTFGSYRQEVYGRDAAYEQMTLLPEEEQIYLPACGVKMQDGAMVAYLEQGGGYAYLNAAPSETVTSYNHAYFDFQLRRSYTFSLEAGDENKEFDRNPLPDDKIVMTCSFLNGEKAELAGMAEAVQNAVFGERQPKASKGDGLFLQTEQSTLQKKNFLGIPYHAQTALTTYDQLTDILAEMKEKAGISKARVTLKNSHKDEVKGKVTSSLRPLGILGGQKGFDRLKEASGAELYQSVRLMTFSKGGNGVNRFFDAVRNQSKAITRLFEYQLSTYQPLSPGGSRYLVAPQKLSDVADKLIKKLPAQATLDVGELANLLYSCYKDKIVYPRSVTEKAVTEQLSKLKKSGAKLTANGANAYALPYLDYVYHVPTSSGRHSVFDEDVPFYQMVLEGYLAYSSPAINESANYSIAFLKALESGSDLSYTLMWNQEIRPDKTAAAGIFHCRYEQLREQMITELNAVQALRKATESSGIKSRTRNSEGLIQIVYQNGAALLLNDTDKTLTNGKYTVEPKNYLILEKGELQ